MKKTICILGICSLSLVLSGSEKYDNPALHKVKFEKPVNSKPVELLRNGKLQFVIVCDLAAENRATLKDSREPIGNARKSLHKAAYCLLKYLRRSFGVQAKMLPPDSPDLIKYPVKIYLGKSKYTDKYGIDITKMPMDGFKVMTVPDGIIIAGRDGSLIPGTYEWNHLHFYAQNGTIGAVVDFLERFLGMRFYYPGIGVIAPTYKNFSIDPVAYTGCPKYWTRIYGNSTSGFHNPGEKPRNLGFTTSMEWPWKDVPNDQNDFRLVWNMESRPTSYMGGEAPHPYVMAKAFPDKLDLCFYRDHKGKLHQSFTQYTANTFDVSNLELSKLLAETYNEFYVSKGKISKLWNKYYIPGPEYMYFGPVDSVAVIENDRTKDLPKRTEPFARMSEINGRFYYDFARRMEKFQPGKKVVLMAYQNYLAAPKRIRKFPDNTRILACTGTPLFIQNKPVRDFWTQICTEWNSKVQEKVVLYPYEAAYNIEGGFGHALRGYFENEFLNRMAPYSHEHIIYPNNFFRWEYYYSYYLMQRAYWNPDFDRDAVLKEHWQLLYGPAAADLQKFFDFAIMRWTRYYIPNAKINHGSLAGLDYKTLYTVAYPKNVIKQMRSMLIQARTKVKKGSIEEKRLIFFLMPWERTLDHAAAYGAAKPPTPCRAVFVENPIRIDGKLDEPVWKKLKACPFRSAYYGEMKKNLKLPMAKIGWTRDGIYLGIWNPAPYKLKKNLWNDDNFEFFLSPGVSKNKLFQFVCSSSGLYEDYFKSFEPPRELDASWKCIGMKKAVYHDARGWSCEMFIPFASLNTERPLAGDSWLFNWVNNRTDTETTSVAPTMGSNRNINFYGKIYFAGNCE